MGSSWSQSGSNGEEEVVVRESFNVDRDVISARDWSAEELLGYTGIISSKVSLRSNMPSLYTSIPRCSSVACAVSLLISYDCATLFRPSVDFLQECMLGTELVYTPRVAFKAIRTHGVCSEEVYNSTQVDGKASRQAYVEASDCTGIEYWCVRYLSGIKRAIASGFPVLGCLELDSAPATENVEPSATGSVALVITGFDDLSSVLEVAHCDGSGTYGEVAYSAAGSLHSLWIVRGGAFENMLVD